MGPAVAEGGRTTAVYFDTWRAAIDLARTCPAVCPKDQWQTSGRFDGWGHALCVRYMGKTTFVVSAGPKANTAVQCQTLRLADLPLEEMHDGRFHPTRTGALALTVRHEPSQ